jgi:ABC-2 type transport system ATP-binding protein
MLDTKPASIVTPSCAEPGFPVAPRVVASWRRATKRFGTVLALDALTLALRAGEVTALLGPNGAGKTTAVRLLLGLSSPTHGSVQVLDADPRLLATRQRVGAMLQVARVPDTLTVQEHLALFSAYYPAPRPADDLLRLVGLERERHRRFGELSGGQRQRLLFAIALCGDPALLVLDEPTVGMDVEARRGLWSVIRDTARRGAAVLLTTHYLEEADALAHRIVLLRQGRVVADDTPAGLKRALRGRVLRCHTALEPARLATLPGVVHVDEDPPHARLVCEDADATVRALLAADPDTRDIDLLPVTLEDAFLAMTAPPDASAGPRRFA